MTRRGNSGVTQLELLVSLAIMGMIAVFLANALNFNRQSLDRARFLSDETEMILAHHTLRDWIEAMPLDYAGGTALEFFDGEVQRLSFRSLVTDGSFHKGVVSEFVLEVSESGENRSLVVRGRGQHPSRSGEHEINRVLADSLSRLKIRYYGRRSSDAEPQWHDSWEDETYLPDLVKIEWETGEGTPVPPLTLQPGKTERQRTMSLSSLVPPG